MGIYKRGRIWWLSYTIDGRQVFESSGSTSRKDAENALVMRKAGIVQGTLQRRFRVCRTAKGVTLAVFVERYLKYARVNKISWLRDEQMSAHLCKAFGQKHLSEVSSLDVENYKIRRLKIVKPATVNREVVLLKRMFNLAKQWDFATENPVKGVKLFREDNIVERILGPEEEERLLAEAHPDLQPILVAALNTGMRLGELLALTWADIDLSQRLLIVRKSKNGRVRRIPINDRLLETFRSLESGFARDAFVFPSPLSGKRRYSLRTAFQAAQKRAGISSLRFHDLRHTFATRLVAAGVDIVTVKELLGHQDISMTLRYAHASPERSLEAVCRLEYDKNITMGSEPKQERRLTPTRTSLVRSHLRPKPGSLRARSSTVRAADS